MVERDLGLSASSLSGGPGSGSATPPTPSSILDPVFMQQGREDRGWTALLHEGQRGLGQEKIRPRGARNQG